MSVTLDTTNTHTSQGDVCHVGHNTQTSKGDECHFGHNKNTHTHHRVMSVTLDTTKTHTHITG